MQKRVISLKFTSNARTKHEVAQETYSYVAEKSGVIGRSTEKEELVELLFDHHYVENVGVLAMGGLGGVGKTTMAKLVYNHRRVK